MPAHELDSDGVQLGADDYASFLELSEAGLGRLIAKIINARRDDCLRILGAFGDKARVREIIANTLTAIAVGQVRIDTVGRIRLSERTEGNPAPLTGFLIEQKIRSASPMIERAVDAFLDEVLLRIRNWRYP